MGAAEVVPFEDDGGPRVTRAGGADAEPWEEGGELRAEPLPPEPGEPDADEADTAGRTAGRMPEPETGTKPPPWARVPKGMVFPRGRQLMFMRFPAEWTHTPLRGDRQCILWELNVGDEKMALQRAQGDPNKVISQFALQGIRAVDGYVVDWTGTPHAPGNVEEWWDAIGGRCRSQIIRWYTMTHVLDRAEQKRFFESCVAVRIVP
jgi:hypothetical protein